LLQLNFVFNLIRPAPRPVVAAALVAAVVGLAPRAALAFDPFEIQVYDGAANDPGAASLELHLNYDHAPKRAVSAPEMAWHKQTHFTFEPALGLTRWWEIGAYFQLAAKVGDTLYWGGTKLRTKFVTPEGWHPHLTLGINFELAFIPERFEADRYGGEIRPIIGWEDTYFHIAMNPNVEFSVAGAGLKEGPAFNPALMALAKIPDVVSFGVEYYASIGPFAHPEPWKKQEHYLFGVANVLALAGWELNFGVGAGLTPGSNDVIVKAIFGHEIGKLWGRPAKPAVPPTPGKAPI
jgi:hypothetical protein